MIYNSPFMMATLSTLIMSTIMAMSSTNWLMLWMALEFNLLSFIPIMSSTTVHQETEASVKYFLTQALGSSLLIMSSMSMWMSPQLLTPMTAVLMVSLVIKIGMAPCHFWYPSVMTSISWIPALILSTWQKLAPLSIMSFILMKLNPSIMMFIAAINAITGGMLGMNQSHLRTILAYSSITHLGWMMALISLNYPLTTLIYFSTYALMIIPIFLTLLMMNSSTLSQMNNSKITSPMNTFMLSIMILSLAGLPPLTGFFPKWMTLTSISPHSIILPLMLILGSLMNLYFYLNIMFTSYLSTPLNSIKPLPQPPSSTTTTFIALFSLSFLPLMMLYALIMLY